MIRRFRSSANHGSTINLSSSFVLQQPHPIGFACKLNGWFFAAIEWSIYFSVKTPGGKLTYQYAKKRGAVPKCGDTKVELPGVRTWVGENRWSMSMNLDQSIASPKDVCQWPNAWKLFHVPMVDLVSAQAVRLRWVRLDRWRQCWDHSLSSINPSFSGSKNNVSLPWSWNRRKWQPTNWNSCNNHHEPKIEIKTTCLVVLLHLIVERHKNE